MYIMGGDVVPIEEIDVIAYVYFGIILEPLGDYLFNVSWPTGDHLLTSWCPHDDHTVMAMRFFKRSFFACDSYLQAWHA